MQKAHESSCNSANFWSGCTMMIELGHCHNHLHIHTYIHTYNLYLHVDKHFITLLTGNKVRVQLPTEKSKVNDAKILKLFLALTPLQIVRFTTLLHFDQGNIKVKDTKCRNRFSAVTLPHIVRFTSSTDYNVPIPSVSRAAVPPTADILLSATVSTQWCSQGHDLASRCLNVKFLWP